MSPNNEVQPKDLAKVTRFDVCDETGRVLSYRNTTVYFSYQDEGRTLKVFIAKR